MQEKKQLERNFQYSILLFFLLVLLIWGCISEQGESKHASTENLSSQEEMRFNQYMVYGQALYAKHCLNCHKEDGKGLGRVIPPLASADYMLEDMGRTACIIKYGLEESIVVNSIDYKQKMPANEKLTTLEIAQVTTYIMNSWENDGGYIPVKEIATYLENCQ